MGRSKQTSTVKIPQWLEDAARSNMAMAEKVGQIGYTPFYGPDVAAFTPMQNAAFENTAATADAFGMATPTGASVTGMPAPQTFAGGIQGYSSGSLYDQAVAELQRRNPGQYAAITNMFINPQSGAAPTVTFPTSAPSAAPSLYNMMLAAQSRGEGGGGNGGGGGGGFASSYLSSVLPGGVNTRNPASAVNQAIGSRTSTNSTPTRSDRPAANPRR